MNKEYQFIVDELKQDQRLDQYLEKELSAISVDISRAFIQNHLDAIRVNNEKKKKNYKVKCGDTVYFKYPEPEPLELIAENIDIDIIFEDEHLIVVNKPAGLVVHPSKGHYTGTLVNALLYKLTEFNLNEEDSEIPRPGIVHRLDKETSGIILVAKNPVVQRKLVTMFQNREITKNYTALVKGKLPESGKIDEPIARHPVYRKKYAVSPNGKEALTYYKRINYFEYFEGHLQRFSLADINIITGRTHQIRVHCSSIGHPVIGDEIYSKVKSPIEKMGMALCASKIQFLHPITKKEMKFEVDLPEYFVKIIEEIQAKIN